MDLDRSPEPYFEWEEGCREYAALPCERAAIDAYLNRRCAALGIEPPPKFPVYPDEFYADKNNRLARRPTGSLRFINVGRGASVVWHPFPADLREKYYGDR